MEREIGTIEAGKLADVIAVEGNPLDDIRAMSRVVFVMKAGSVYKSP
jgi:imidazolonepropionase-like amidohydrolase